MSLFEINPSPQSNPDVLCLFIYLHFLEAEGGVGMVWNSLKLWEEALIPEAPLKLL